MGARPVFVDVQPDTYGLDQNRVLACINKKTRAIIPVHLYGEDAGRFTQFGIRVVEDSCEALGIVQQTGHLACYSFYGNKVIVTGEGGMLCGDLGNARQWRDGGFDEHYRNTIPGLNYRMSNLQAAVGLAQIERFDTLLVMRLENARKYREVLPGKGKWLFVVDSDNPMELAKHLEANGVQTRSVFTPLHRSPAFSVYAKGKYKVADRIWERGLCLPTGPHVSANDIDKIVELVHGYRRKLVA